MYSAFITLATWLVTVSPQQLRALSSLCIYPCFSTSSRIRDPEDIMAVPRMVGDSLDTATFTQFLTVTYALIGTSAVWSITVGVITSPFCISFSVQTRTKDAYACGGVAWTP